jgi:hypothetical protein
MAALKKDPLRPLSPEERSHLERLSRALGLPAALVARAKVLLAVANGYSYTAAAQLAGRRRALRLSDYRSRSASPNVDTEGAPRLLH